jgi:hypothetical protein
MRSRAVRALVAIVSVLAVASPGSGADEPPAAKDADRRFDALLTKALADPAGADWKALKRAFADTSAYSPYSTEVRELLDEARKLIDAKKFKEAEPLVKQALERDRYMKIGTHMFAGAYYDTLGDKKKEQFHRACIMGLAGTLLVPGKGLSAENAIVVIFVEEEYFFLRVLELKVKRQGLREEGGHKYDVFESEPEGDKPARSFYFNVDLPQKALARQLRAPAGAGEKAGEGKPAATPPA